MSASMSPCTPGDAESTTATRSMPLRRLHSSSTRGRVMAVEAAIFTGRPSPERPTCTWRSAKYSLSAGVSVLLMVKSRTLLLSNWTSAIPFRELRRHEAGRGRGQKRRRVLFRSAAHGTQRHAPARQLLERRLAPVLHHHPVA